METQETATQVLAYCPLEKARTQLPFAMSTDQDPCLPSTSVHAKATRKRVALVGRACLGWKMRIRSGAIARRVSM